MKDFTFIMFLVFYTQLLYSQDYNSSKNRVYFSEQISTYISEYTYKIAKAEASENYLKVAELYNEFIEQKLIGSYLDHFNISCFDRKKNNLGDFKKPLILLTYASWCGPLEKELGIFNKSVEEYHERIDFLVLIWDSKKQARKLSKRFNRESQILYVNELRNRDGHTIRMLKHALGVPTIIITNSSKQIKEVLKLTPTFPDLFEHKFDKNFQNGIKSIASF